MNKFLRLLGPTLVHLVLPAFSLYGGRLFGKVKKCVMIEDYLSSSKFTLDEMEVKFYLAFYFHLFSNANLNCL